MTLIRGKTLNQIFDENPRSAINLDKLPPTLLQILDKEPNEIFKCDQKIEYENRIDSMIKECEQKIQERNKIEAQKI